MRPGDDVYIPDYDNHPWTPPRRRPDLGTSPLRGPPRPKRFRKKQRHHYTAKADKAIRERLAAEQPASSAVSSGTAGASASAVNGSYTSPIVVSETQTITPIIPSIVASSVVTQPEVPSNTDQAIPTRVENPPASHNETERIPETPTTFDTNPDIDEGLPFVDEGSLSIDDDVLAVPPHDTSNVTVASSADVDLNETSIVTTVSDRSIATSLTIPTQDVSLVSNGTDTSLTSTFPIDPLLVSNGTNASLHSGSDPLEGLQTFNRIMGDETAISNLRSFRFCGNFEQLCGLFIYNFNLSSATWQAVKASDFSYLLELLPFELLPHAYFEDYLTHMCDNRGAPEHMFKGQFGHKTNDRYHKQSFVYMHNWLEGHVDPNMLASWQYLAYQVQESIHNILPATTSQACTLKRLLHEIQRAHHKLSKLTAPHQDMAFYSKLTYQVCRSFTSSELDATAPLKRLFSRHPGLVRWFQMEPPMPPFEAASMIIAIGRKSRFTTRISELAKTYMHDSHAMLIRNGAQLFGNIPHEACCHGIFFEKSATMPPFWAATSSPSELSFQNQLLQKLELGKPWTGKSVILALHGHDALSVNIPGLLDFGCRIFKMHPGIGLYLLVRERNSLLYDGRSSFSFTSALKGWRSDHLIEWSDHSYAIFSFSKLMASFLMGPQAFGGADVEDEKYNHLIRMLADSYKRRASKQVTLAGRNILTKDNHFGHQQVKLRNGMSVGDILAL